MKLRILVIAMLIGLGACSDDTDKSRGGPAGPFKHGALEGLKAVTVNGVTLNFRVQGEGETIVFVHGALGDYREWGSVIEALPDGYRRVAYSRRYNYPNTNSLAGEGHSPYVAAQDLKAFIGKLGAEPVHVVGVSYGALTALLAALERPDLVRTLTIVEPPLIAWLPDLPGGKVEHERVYRQLIAPSAAAFEAGAREQALRAAMDFFVGPGAIDRFPERVRESLRANLKEWKAITTASEPFPPVSREEIRQLNVPVLMISGGRTYSFQKLIDAELTRVLPAPERKIVPQATHQVCGEVPQVCASAIREHVARG